MWLLCICIKSIVLSSAVPRVLHPTTPFVSRSTRNEGVGVFGRRRVHSSSVGSAHSKMAHTSVSSDISVYSKSPPGRNERRGRSRLLAIVSTLRVFPSVFFSSIFFRTPICSVSSLDLCSGHEAGRFPSTHTFGPVWAGSHSSPSSPGPRSSEPLDFHSTTRIAFAPIHKGRLHDPERTVWTELAEMHSDFVELGSTRNRGF